MVRRWQIFALFLHPVFSASCVQRISDLHSKFAVRPHHVWKYGRHPLCDCWQWARKKDKPQLQNIMFASIMQGGHNNKLQMHTLCEQGVVQKQSLQNIHKGWKSTTVKRSTSVSITLVMQFSVSLVVVGFFINCNILCFNPLFIIKQ